MTVWNDITTTFVAEFSDLPDAAQWTRLLLRLALAMLLGGAIGYEREQRGSTAGLRTHMLVALGTALFVLVPQQSGMNADQLSRVIQGLLAGIGFLGAGAVVKASGSGSVRGLTTAAGLWATAAVGIAVGLGREATALVSTLLIVLILGVLLRWERKVERRDSAHAGEPALSPRASAAPDRGSSSAGT